jgi:hypothetical protein
MASANGYLKIHAVSAQLFLRPDVCGYPATGPAKRKQRKKREK